MAARKETAKKESALRDYRRKRDPRATNEPFGAEHKRSETSTRIGRFVVHLHDATRAHYDLRLEVGGTLMSFAVPKGPSADPNDKRLAVNTEHHPIEYLEFEDVIPAGNYGAGPMIAWDLGRVTYLEGTAEEGIARGKIDFALSGFKLRGRFGLIHTGGRKGGGDENQWLLVKKRDAHSSEDVDLLADERSVLSGLTVTELARSAELFAELQAEAERLGAKRRDVDVREMEPMLCAATGAELDDPDRVYELKLDGVRIVADRRGDNVVLRYRRGRAATISYPEIVRAVRALPAGRVVLDGEIVAFDETGRPNFRRLAPRIHALRPREVLRARSEVPVVYLVFDLLALGDWDLRALSLLERKSLLARLVQGKGLVQALDHIEGRGQALFDMCQEQSLEGVVAKRKIARYRPGSQRSEDWVKIKCERDDEFVVVGWEEGRGARRELGALVLAAWEDDHWVLRGRVGSGLDARTLSLLRERLAGLATDRLVATGELSDGRGKLHPVQPEVVVSVRFVGYTEEGVLLHPVFRGVRDDIVPQNCTAAPPRGDDPQIVVPAADQQGSGRVTVTNRNKVFWPEEGLTKGDLCDYYAEVAEVMVPFLRDRPVVLVRYPDGIEGKNFFQWRAPEGTPEWIRTLELRDEEDQQFRGKKSVFLIDSADALVHIANLGAIPIHVLASRAESLEHGDFFTIDFDVALSTFRDAVTLALALRELLEEVGLEGYPKTSGQSGLHVLVPVGPKVPFTVTKALAELFGRLLTASHPKIATMERRVQDRGARVYVDTGQTGRGRTIVAPYSVRAVRGATVSTPLQWDEVHAALDPRQFDMSTVPIRLAERGDPMADMLDARPDVMTAIQRLEGRVKG